MTTFLARPNSVVPGAPSTPTLTATAYYHKRLEPALAHDLRATLNEVERFASGESLLALQKGSALADAERDGEVREHVLPDARDVEAEARGVQTVHAVRLRERSRRSRSAGRT